MIMIAILHGVLMMVILPMLLPLIRSIKIDFQGIPILAEHLPVIHFSQKFYGMPLLQLCFKHSECSKSSNKCYHFKHAKGGYKTKTTIWFLMKGNDSLYFAIIPLTPSATRTIMLGSPNDSPCFGQKRKITIHLSLFTDTIHRYCSLRNFAYLRGVVPYIQSKCF